MDAESLAQVIRETVAEIFELEPEEVSDDKDFFNDFRADSLSFLELIVALEKKLDFHYPSHEVSNISSIDALIKLTQKYV